MQKSDHQLWSGLRAAAVSLGSSDVPDWSGLTGHPRPPGSKLPVTWHVTGRRPTCPLPFSMYLHKGRFGFCSGSVQRSAGQRHPLVTVGRDPGDVRNRPLSPTLIQCGPLHSRRERRRGRRRRGVKGNRWQMFADEVPSCADRKPLLSWGRGWREVEVRATVSRTSGGRGAAVTESHRSRQGLVL